MELQGLINPTIKSNRYSLTMLKRSTIFLSSSGSSVAVLADAKQRPVVLWLT